MRCESGNPCIMGCNRIENGYNFAYDCSTDTDIKLCFFDRDTLELKEEIPLKKRMGTVHSVCVCDILLILMPRRLQAVKYLELRGKIHYI